MNWSCLASLLLFVLPVACAREPLLVGPQANGSHLVATGQMIHPAGQSLEFGGRPVALALSPDGRTLYVKDDRGLVVIDAEKWTLRQELSFPQGGGSAHGLAVSADGSTVYATTAQTLLWEAKVRADGKLDWGRKIELPGPGGQGDSDPCGLALARDGRTLYVCLSRNNTLGMVDLAAGKLVREIPVGVAPFDVVLANGGGRAWVSNWGGRRAQAGEKTANSAGTETLVDERGVAASGTVSLVDLQAGKENAQVATGLHPSDLQLSADGGTLYVANANSDTVSVIETATPMVRESINVRPDEKLPFGSAPNALLWGGDGRTLFVANGGNNAVGVVGLAEPAGSALRGFIPTAWYPGALASDGKNLYVANIKGIGSRRKQPGVAGWHVFWQMGVVSKMALPDAPELKRYTEQVKADACAPQFLRAWDKAQSGQTPVPVPTRTGEPSVFEHVIYVIKENRTYDQYFGDLSKGNGDPSLCVFGREVSPNHHALAEQFALLDNYYCNGVKSVDGHSWAIEGNVTDYLEKAFGGFTRSYTFGDDPITYSSSGFIWDGVLQHGLSFRNYGEYDVADSIPNTHSFSDIYNDFIQGPRKIKLSHNIGIERLRRYSHPEYPGWGLKIPDVLRMDIYLKDLKECEKTGVWPNFQILHLPQDHTSGGDPGFPTPRASVADNDLALGRLVEGISKSRFWDKTCIFVIEDDPQDGFDHVDGHRSICLVISPYTKRGAVVSKFYNQTAVLHTMERIMGLPPMNQMDGRAPLMRDCFTNKPDLTPYTALPNNIPLNQLNKQVSELNEKERVWAEKSMAQDLSIMDAVDDDTFNRIIWHAVKGVDTPYPAEFAGAHGKGLKGLDLTMCADAGEADDDDD